MQPKRAHDRKRGRHKKHASLATRLWNAQYLVPPPPPWMDTATWRKLVEMREARR